MTAPFVLAGRRLTLAEVSARLAAPAAAPPDVPPLSVVPADAPGLYVGQREYAVAPRASGRLVGTDAATTCLMLLACDADRVFCAHLDGAPGQPAATAAALAAAFPAAPVVTVHLAGGMNLGAVGEEVVAGGLAALDRFARRTAATLHVETARVLAGNTLPGPVPAVRALALDTRTDTLLSNHWFADHGPAAVARQAFAWLGREPLRLAYRPDDLSPTPLPSAADLPAPPADVLIALLALGDEELLERTSTSPRAEHPGYAAEMRAQLRWLLADR